MTNAFGPLDLVVDWIDEIVVTVRGLKNGKLPSTPEVAATLGIQNQLALIRLKQAEKHGLVERRGHKSWPTWHAAALSPDASKSRTFTPVFRV